MNRKEDPLNSAHKYMYIYIYIHTLYTYVHYTCICDTVFFALL